MKRFTWEGEGKYGVCSFNQLKRKLDLTEAEAEQIDRLELGWDCEIEGGLGGKDRPYRIQRVSDDEYYTIVLRYQDNGSPWHPTDPTGPFSVLTRGAFETEYLAEQWAAEHVSGYPFEIRKVVNV